METLHGLPTTSRAVEQRPQEHLASCLSTSQVRRIVRAEEDDGRLRHLQLARPEECEPSGGHGYDQRQDGDDKRGIHAGAGRIVACAMAGRRDRGEVAGATTRESIGKDGLLRRRVVRPRRRGAETVRSCVEQLNQARQVALARRLLSGSHRGGPSERGQTLPT